MADRRVIVVTGAGSGIGRATALQLAAAGASLALVGRRAEPLQETARRCAEYGVATAVIADDVGDAEAPVRIVDATMAQLGRIDGIVNNAGTAALGALASVTPEALATMFAVNVIGPILLVRAALDELQRNTGSVVNVASGAGVNAAARAVGYGASKAALIHATRSLARELGPGVRVNAVVPGTCRTEIWERTGLAPDAIENRLRELGAMIPAGRVGEPEEVARWICMLLDPASAWVTGAAIAVDGGFTA